MSPTLEGGFLTTDHQESPARLSSCHISSHSPRTTSLARDSCSVLLCWQSICSSPILPSSPSLSSGTAEDGLGMRGGSFLLRRSYRPESLAPLPWAGQLQTCLWGGLSVAWSREGSQEGPGLVPTVREFTACQGSEDAPKEPGTQAEGRIARHRSTQGAMS